MKQSRISMIMITLSILCFVNLSAQKFRPHYSSMAVTTSHTAFPFGNFSSLFTKEFHPGFEVAAGFDLKSKEKHDWFLELKSGYFYHRFVQHGIPVYANLGYRYKLNSQFSAETSLGLGYMHSIPATSKFKLENGEYVNNKGVGRMQGMVNFALGLNYVLNPSVKKPITAFALYQQRLQMPFIKSYVPLLPYNSFQLGMKMPFSSKQTSKQN